jgi:hypothetical protein
MNKRTESGRDYPLSEVERKSLVEIIETNSKLEIRNSKEITMFKKNKILNILFEILNFGFLD